MNFQEKLPPELWTRIFEMSTHSTFSSPKNDIASVRLVCGLFEQLATPYLMSSIHCAPLSNSLRTFKDISFHPVLSQAIKTIIYDCSRYQNIRTLCEYEESLRRANPSFFRSPASKEDVLELEAMFIQNKRHYHDQIMVENSGEFTACLCSALMRMPNVETVIISPNCYRCLENSRPSKYFLRPEPEYGHALL